MVIVRDSHRHRGSKTIRALPQALATTKYGLEVSDRCYRWSIKTSISDGVEWIPKACVPRL